MKYALFIYTDDARTKLAFDNFYESTDAVERVIREAYVGWVKEGGDECGLSEWRKDYKLFEFTNYLP